MDTHEVTSKWISNLTFESQVGNHTVRMDSMPPLGDDSGASPKKLLLAGLVGCTGIDVASMLEKMRVTYDGLEIDAEADLTDEHPRVYSEIRLTYRIYGKDIDRSKVEKAVNLSEEKYCGVSAMLQKNCPILFTIEYRDGRDQ